jgi:predicted N-acetyltransferase YhbS
MEIRAARREEAARLTSIARTSKASWGYPQDWLHLWEDELTLTPGEIDRAMVWVATAGESILGYCALAATGDPEALEIDGFFVAPEHMGTGVGRALMRHAMAQAIAAGARRLKIVSDPNAEGFYRRFGARRIGWEPSRPPGRQLPVLAIDLTDPHLDKGEQTP